MNISRKRFGEDEEGGNPAVGSRSINRRLFDDNDGGDSSKGFKYTIEPLRNQLLRIGMVLFAAIICLYVFVTHGGFSALEDIESMVISKYSASTTHITSATPVRIPARASLTPPLDSHELIAHGERNGETGKLAESAKVKALDLPIVSTGNAKDSAPDLGLKGRVGSGMPIIPLHSTPTSSEAELRAHEDSLAAQDLVQYESRTIAAIEAIRDMKFNRHIVIENNAEAQRKVSVAQRMIRALLKRKYGNGPYRLEMVLEFPDIMVDDGTHPQEYNKDGTRKGGLGARQESLLVTMGDIEYIPYSVYFWLENILKPFHKGAFHRNAGHVLQAMLKSDPNAHHKHSAFAWQEYSPSYPHKQYTLGYAGRPSGSSAFYISTVDNTRNHGPGSQGSKTEADAVFGSVDSVSIGVVKRMSRQPGAKGGAGFINDGSKHIQIVSMKLIT